MKARDRSGKHRVGVLLCDTENPFWRTKIELYGALADSYGFDVSFRAAEDPKDPEGQCRELSAMRDEAYDAVILNPLTERNLLPALAGLPFPVFDVGPKCDPERTAGIADYFPLTAADFEEQGHLAGRALVSASEPDGESWAVILGGFCDARHSSMRCRGALRAFRKAFAPRHIVTVHADFDRGEARRAARALLPRLGVRAVFCANDLMALGVLDALSESPGASVPVGGVDAIPEALEALRDGRLFCTVSLPHEEVVRGVYRAVAERLAGAPVSGGPLGRSVLLRRS